MLINTQIFAFPDLGDTQGHLTPIEAQKTIPFEIKRVYYITRVPAQVRRGFHSHRKLEQVLICLHGSVKVSTRTPFEEQITLLDDTTQGLYIGNMIWREMFDFTDDAVLLVLASETYDESDYIRNYEVYEKEALDFFASKRQD